MSAVTRTHDALARANALLDRQLAESALVSRLQALIELTDDMPTLLEACCRVLRGACPVSLVSVGVRGPRGLTVYAWAPAGLSAGRQADVWRAVAKRWRQAGGDMPRGQRPAVQMLGRPPRAGRGSPGRRPSVPGALASVPLKSRGTLIGVLVAAAGRPAPVDPRVARMLRVAAPVLTTLIDGALWRRRSTDATEQLEQEVRRLSILLELSGQILTTDHSDALLDRILQQCVDAVRAEGGSLMLLDKDGRTLEVTRSLGRGSRRILGTRIAVGERIAGWVARHRKPQLLADSLKRHPVFASVQPYRRIRSSMVVPLLSKRALLGVLSLNRWVGREAFGESDIQLAMTVANYAAMVLERHRLSDRLTTSHRQLEETQTALMQSEKLAVLGQLAAAVAHELNNPLSVISSRAQLLLMEEPENAVWKRNLEHIVTQAHRASGMIARLLSFSRPPKGAHGVADLRRAFDEALDAARCQVNMDRVTIRTTVPPGMPAVVGDVDELQEVLVNLMVNAVQAMSGRGTLTLRASVERGRPRMIRVECRDTGEGIAAEHLPHVFDPFFTRKQYGTGLGLFVVRQVMEALGGTVDVRSRPGRGTVFLLRIPVAGST